MPRYKVWNPDHEAEAEALVVYDYSPAHAGENYVSEIADGYSDSYDLLVADEDGVRYEVTVDVDYTPSFMSWAKVVK